MRTEFGLNSAQDVQIWSAMTMREALKKTFFYKFLGKAGDKRAVIQRLEDLEKSRGSTIKYDLLMQLTGAGVTGDARMKGQEEPLVYHQDSVVVDQLRNAHSFTNMTQQRTVHDLRMDAMDNLSDWFALKYDSYMFRNLCGDTTITHGQAASAPDTDHVIYSGDATSTATITSAHQLTLADLDYAKEKAKTLTPPIRPVIINGGEYFVVVVHTYSENDLRHDAAGSTYVSWPDIQSYANKRGLDNPIFAGGLGVYNNMVLFDSHQIYSPSANVRRHMFLGAQAGVFAMANAYKGVAQKKYGGKNMFSWFEETDDYGNETGVAVGSVFGMKKTRYNSKDYAAIAVESYSAAHT